MDVTRLRPPARRARRWTRSATGGPVPVHSSHGGDRREATAVGPGDDAPRREATGTRRQRGAVRPRPATAACTPWPARYGLRAVAGRHAREPPLAAAARRGRCLAAAASSARHGQPVQVNGRGTWPVPGATAIDAPPQVQPPGGRSCRAGTLAPSASAQLGRLALGRLPSRATSAGLVTRGRRSRCSRLLDSSLLLGDAAGTARSGATPSSGLPLGGSSTTSLFAGAGVKAPAEHRLPERGQPESDRRCRCTGTGCGCPCGDSAGLPPCCCPFVLHYG